MNARRITLVALPLLIGGLWLANRPQSPATPEAEPPRPAPPPTETRLQESRPPAIITDPTAANTPATPADDGASAASPAAQTLLDWMRQPVPATEAARNAWLQEGRALAEARRPQMAAWIVDDPRRALSEAVTPRQFAALPEEIRSLVERPVVEEGFFGVLAICGHGPDEDHIEGACQIEHHVMLNFGTFDAEGFTASIYGAREKKMTVESDSIFGVALDGHMALHEDEIVIVDDGEGWPEGRFAVYYRGNVRFADTQEQAEALRANWQ